MAYPSLKIGAPARLAIFKREAAKLKCAWQKVRFATLRSTSGLDQGSNNNAPIWYCHNGEQFRNERFCDDVTRMDHTGWFTDTDYSETARGIVACLPHGRFIAGYYLTMNDERVYFPEIFTDEHDCALMADEHARIIGEYEQAHAQRFDEAQALESDIEDAFSRLRECICLRHVACMDYVRDEIRELIETIRDKRETLENDYAGVL